MKKMISSIAMGLLVSFTIASSADAKGSGLPTAPQPISPVKYTTGYTAVDGTKVSCDVRENERIECSNLALQESAESLRWALTALSEWSELKCKREFEIYGSGIKFVCTQNGTQENLDFKFSTHYDYGYYWQAPIAKDIQLSERTVDQKVFGYVACKGSYFDYVSMCSVDYRDPYRKIVATLTIGVNTYDGLLKYIRYYRH